MNWTDGDIEEISYWIAQNKKNIIIQKNRYIILLRYNFRDEEIEHTRLKM